MTDSNALARIIPTPKRRRWPWLAGAVVLALILGGAAYLVLRPRNLTISGEVELVSSSTTRTGAHCSGAGGYADITAGADVTITDASGKVVAIGALEPGATTVNLTCGFQFSVAAPAGLGFYGLTIGHRSKVQYPEAALARPIHLTLGR